MRPLSAVLGCAAVAAVALAAQSAATGGARAPRRSPTPADGHSIHVIAPHVYQGHEMGPVHHYCKVTSPEPIITCLLYDSADTSATLHGIEYIVAKTLTRPGVSLGTWNSNFHDHSLEIATGRVKVLDMPAEDAQKVAALVSTTDGIIFHLWPTGDRFPTGTVVIDQAVGHRPMTAPEYERSQTQAARTGRD